MAEISKITLPSGNTYDIKDTVARSAAATAQTTANTAIEMASGTIHIKGTTTTALTDGATTNPITINGSSYTAVSNDAVFYGTKEFIFDGSTWHEFGSSISKASSSNLGVIKLGSDTVQTVAAVTPTTSSGRTYPVQLNSSDQAVVNVPWSAPSASNADPAAVGTTASQGSSSRYSRQDHVHNIVLATGDANGQVKIAGSNVDVKGWNEKLEAICDIRLSNQTSITNLNSGIITRLDTVRNGFSYDLVGLFFNFTNSATGISPFTANRTYEGIIYHITGTGSATAGFSVIVSESVTGDIFTNYHTATGTWGTWRKTGALAWKSSVSAPYTPAGSVTVTTNATTNKTATVSTTSGTVTYTPGGTVGTPTISVKTAGTTTTVKNPTSVEVAKTVATAAPGATAPANAVTTCDVSNETLRLYQVGYTTSDSITTSNVTVKTGDAEYQSSQPSWTGTGVRLVTGNIAVPNTYTASFSGTAATITSE